MKNKYSLFACILIIIVLISFRFIPERYKKTEPLVVTTWDGLGYYLYLPSFFIYHDYKELAWFPAIDKKYSVSGGWVYQANRCKSGHYVFKYLGGVAIMESPFFLIGHMMASYTGYPLDGFSPPYQFAIVFGAFIYFMLSIFILRRILLRYFNDSVTALTLLLVILATNIIQYISIDSAMSHSYIFPMYALILYFTIKWHENPSVIWASLIGAVMGIAAISRPTEAIMLFIPLLWGTQSKISSAEKWKKVRQNKLHIYSLVAFGFLALLPQLLYWKSATGSFVYDVGSKWNFLNPYFRVLTGWETGWFIYTPVTVFFMAGMFFMKKYSFKNSVITFCLLNIYIIISWHDWKYGATYSCRALSHSYPVFALPLAAFIERIRTKKIRWVFYGLSLYLIFLNLFQLKQYNQSIIHARDMNRKYYFSVYLNPHPTPLDMSLLDNNDFLTNEKKYQKRILFDADTSLKLLLPEYAEKILYETKIEKNKITNTIEDVWIRIDMTIKLNDPKIWGGYIKAELKTKDSVKVNKIRIINAITKTYHKNDYSFYVKIPPYFNNSTLKLFINSKSPFDGDLKRIYICYLFK